MPGIDGERLFPVAAVVIDGREVVQSVDVSGIDRDGRLEGRLSGNNA
jgi:hypothetical protein